MKRRGFLLEQIAEPNNLRWAFLTARRGKSASREVIQFQDRFDAELANLRQQIIQGDLKPGGYRRFVIFEPKRREICAGSFRDNVLHHAILRVCHQDFERRQIFHSYACRRGKGTHAAIRQARQNAHRYGWYGKLDVRDFFASIHHTVCRRQLRRIFKDQRLLDLLDQIINTYHASPGRGLPLGNLTSQYFANHYLTPVDYWANHSPDLTAYVRYMDDMVLWSDSKFALRRSIAQVERLVQDQLRCQLKSPVLQPTARGLSFLGYRVFPHDLRLTQQSRRRLARRLNRLALQLAVGKVDEDTAMIKAQSMLAFAKHANVASLLRQLTQNADIRAGLIP
jgi:RNA-directed DNA polymerase